MPFSYPDLLHWTPPKMQVDAVGLAGGEIALAGLGWLEQVEETEPVVSGGSEFWWTRSDFGASLLVRHRAKLRELPRGNWPVRRDRLVAPHHARQLQLPDMALDQTAESSLATRPRNADPDRPTYSRHGSSPDTAPDSVDIYQMLRWVARNGFSEQAIGYATKRVAELGTAEQYVAFTRSVRSAIRRGERRLASTGEARIRRGEPRPERRR